MAEVLAPSGSLAWTYALWPYGIGAAAAGGLAGATGGVLGALPYTRLVNRAYLAGGVGRWAAVGATLLLLFAVLVAVPSFLGAVARMRA